MSPIFIKAFKKENRCPHCSVKSGAGKLPGKSLCQLHLVMAKLQWRSWQTVRRAAGLCCYCHLKSFRGWLRCRKHREINRVKCVAWMKQHPQHSHNQWVKIKETRLNRGICRCRARNPLEIGKRACTDCLVRDRAYGKVRRAGPR